MPVITDCCMHTHICTHASMHARADRKVGGGQRDFASVVMDAYIRLHMYACLCASFCTSCVAYGLHTCICICIFSHISVSYFCIQCTYVCMTAYCLDILFMMGAVLFLPHCPCHMHLFKYSFCCIFPVPAPLSMNHPRYQPWH